jgi:hypothetical protein
MTRPRDIRRYLLSFQKLIMSLTPCPDKRLHNQELVLGRLSALAYRYWLEFRHVKLHAHVILNHTTYALR